MRSLLQALMKIVKHAREAHQIVPAPAGTSNATVTFSPAVGQLLGIDSNGVLDVSNTFALPAGSLGGAQGEESETRGVKAGKFRLSHYSQQLKKRQLIPLLLSPLARSLQVHPAASSPSRRPQRRRFSHRILHLHQQWTAPRHVGLR